MCQARIQARIASVVAEALGRGRVIGWRIASDLGVLRALVLGVLVPLILVVCKGVEEWCGGLLLRGRCVEHLRFVEDVVVRSHFWHGRCKFEQ